MSKASQVHNEIMNIQGAGHGSLDYKIGHRDARHVAAEIAMQAVAKLEAEKPQWIPVSERLPKYERRVPILYKYKDMPRLIMFIGEYSPFEDRWRNTELHDIEILYWLDDVPQPPKGGES